MTATTAQHVRRDASGDGGPIRFTGLVHSEWIKLRSLRSTMWSVLLLVLPSVGIGTLVAALANSGGGAITGDAARSALVQYSTAGTTVSVLIAAVVGALSVTGEYGTGMIRSTFMAAPRRWTALAAKGLVLAALLFIATAVSVWATAFLALPIADTNGVKTSLDLSVAMPLLGASVYLTLIGLLAFAVGIMLRSTAAAIATVLGVLLVAPVLVQLVQGFTNATWLGTVRNLLPQNAGQQLMRFGTTSTAGWHDGVLTLDGWSGFAVLLGWVAVTMIAGLMVVERRDA